MGTPRVVLLLALLTGCGPSGDGEPATAREAVDSAATVDAATAATVGAVPPGVLDEARSAASALGSRLQARLTAALEEGGPLGAVEVCSVEAQEIARALSVDGTIARRVSLRTRNPMNDPDAWETARLEALARAWGEADVAPDEWEVVEDGGGRVLRYLRPIPLAQPCTTCHGTPEEIPSEVLTLIRELYPQDRAVGYAPGDLRGAVSVLIPLEGS